MICVVRFHYARLNYLVRSKTTAMLGNLLWNLNENHLAVCIAKVKSVNVLLGVTAYDWYVVMVGVCTVLHCNYRWDVEVRISNDHRCKDRSAFIGSDTELVALLVIL